MKKYPTSGFNCPLNGRASSIFPMLASHIKNLFTINTSLLAISLSLIFLSSCTPPRRSLTKAPKVDSNLAFSLLKQGALIKPRHSGSVGATQTVTFITRFIKQLEVNCRVDSWKDDTPNGKIDFANVVADIPGESNKFIIVGCHYDTKKLASVPDFEGANDGASGVGLLLAMISAISKFPSKSPYSLKFLFFDGEECILEYTSKDGLYGSRYYANKLKSSGEIEDCVAVIILDMVGDKYLDITIPSGTDKELARKLFDITKRQKTQQYFSQYSIDIIDDHTPFQRMGIPVIDIIDFNFGKSNRYWHTSADTVDKTSEESLKIVGDAALQLIWDI